jgi:hypothetical protein
MTADDHIVNDLGVTETSSIPAAQKFVAAAEIAKRVTDADREALALYRAAGAADAAFQALDLGAHNVDCQEARDAFAIRFLRANKYDVQKTMANVREYAEWRQDWNVNNALFSDLALATGAIPPFSLAIVKDSASGQRAIATFLSKGTELTMPPTMVSLLMFIVIFEAFERTATGSVEERLAEAVMYGSMAGGSMAHFDPRLEKEGARWLQRYWPGRMGPVIMTDVPALFRVLFKICAPFYGDLMKKILLLSGPGANAILRAVFPPCMLPESLGGAKPDAEFDFATTVANYAEAERAAGLLEGRTPWAPSAKVVAEYREAVGGAKLMKSVISGTALKRTMHAIRLRHTPYFLALSENCLFYFKNETASRPNGAIVLEDACVSGPDDVPSEVAKTFPRGAKHAFCLHTPERTYYFCVQERSHAELWVRCLRRYTKPNPA